MRRTLVKLTPGGMNDVSKISEFWFIDTGLYYTGGPRYSLCWCSQLELFEDFKMAKIVHTKGYVLSFIKVIFVFVGLSFTETWPMNTK